MCGVYVAQCQHLLQAITEEAVLHALDQDLLLTATNAASMIWCVQGSMGLSAEWGWRPSSARQ